MNVKYLFGRYKVLLSRDLVTSSVIVRRLRRVRWRNPRQAAQVVGGDGQGTRLASPLTGKIIGIAEWAEEASSLGTPFPHSFSLSFAEDDIRLLFSILCSSHPPSRRSLVRARCRFCVVLDAEYRVTVEWSGVTPDDGTPVPVSVSFTPQGLPIARPRPILPPLETTSSLTFPQSSPAPSPTPTLLLLDHGFARISSQRIDLPSSFLCQGIGPRLSHRAYRLRCDRDLATQISALSLFPAFY